MSYQLPSTLGSLYNDIIRAANTAEVTSRNEDEVKKILSVYQDFFSGVTSAVTMRTTTKPKEKRDLSVRYIDFTKPHNPFEMALKAGLIKREGHPVEDLFDESVKRFSMIGYGVDIGIAHGFEKLWPVFRHPYPMEDVYSMATIPSSVREYADHFARFGFSTCYHFAIDYFNKTANLYFMVNDPTLFPPEKTAAMIQDLGFVVPSQAELDANAKAVVIYYTFSWESPHIERLCFVTAGPAGIIPTLGHPLVEKYVAEAPFRADVRLFTFGTTYSVKGDYLKIEADYNAMMGNLLMQLSGVA